ncbi:enoyl-CoA hydratase-related protein [Novosphingobium sp.]|uniref:enoyl-CoA hydratase-related protein n=1 Tax=Novosphingobium sp. TaxID=1874826 RepID=UPI003BA854A6
MSDVSAGRVYTERHDYVLKIVIENVAKKNALSPKMMAKLSDALTLLENDDALWVGVLCAEGGSFTAGLDMPKFFGPTATVKPDPEGNIDPFDLANQCTKPIVTAVQGICYTIGIELMLSGVIVVAASDARFCQMEAQRGRGLSHRSGSGGCRTGPASRSRRHPRHQGPRHEQRPCGRGDPILCGAQGRSVSREIDCRLMRRKSRTALDSLMVLNDYLS